MTGEGVLGIVGECAAGLSSRAETRDLLYYEKMENLAKKWPFGKKRITGLVAFGGRRPFYG